MTKHAEVVADRPPFSDMTLEEPVHCDEVAIVVSWRCLDAQKWSAMPAAMPGPDLDDIVALATTTSLLQP